MKRQQIIALSILTALIIFVVLVSSGKISLSPRTSTVGASSCQLGPLTDCINGCWETYNNRTQDIRTARNAHTENCCSRAPECEFAAGSCFQRDSMFSCMNGGYLSCIAEFDYWGLMKQAEEDRKSCIKNCQNSFCGGTASN